MKILSSRIEEKQKEIKLLCIYGDSHFCDGRPNKSVDDRGTYKKPCPMYNNCSIRHHSIFEEKKL